MQKELIRTDIMDLTMAQWDKVRQIEKSGFIEVTPKELIDLIGFTGGMFFGLKANNREKQFIKSFYALGLNA
jgi:hypothetical protein